MLRSLFVVLALSSASGVAPGQTLVQRMNCGGGALVSGGVPWDADATYQVGVQDGYVGGFALPVLSGFNGDFIGGQQNPYRTVYQDARCDWSAYRFEVPAGDYIVRLLLAEIQNQGVGLRELDLYVEGVPVLAGADLALLHGVQYGAELVVLVTVSDGVLDVTADPGPGVDPEGVEAPILNAIEVWEKETIGGPPATVTGMEVRPGYHRNILVWDWNVDPNVEGFRVYRADSASGPYSQVAELWAAPPRWFDDAAPLGATRYYRVTAFDVDGNESAQNAEQSAAAADSADSTLPVYDLTVSAANLEFISKNILLQPKEEVPAVFEHAGDTWADAETRFRGSSSRLVAKKSWTVQFPAVQEFQGRRNMNLKASFFDRSLVRERLAMSLWDSMGVVAPRVDPVHLRVNDVYMGVFNQAEDIDEVFLAARGRHPDVVIHDVEVGNMMPLGTLAAYEAAYPIETNTGEGHADLIALIEFLDEAPTAEFEAELADRFDVDAYLSYLAGVAWVGDIDTIQRNYYLAHDLSLGRWELWPWDSDFNLGLLPGLDSLDVLYGTSAVTSDPLLIHQLRERVLGLDSLLWRYCEKLAELDALGGDPALLQASITDFLDDVEVDVLADPNKAGWETEGIWTPEESALSAFVVTRSSFVLAQAASVQPASPPTVVWINELQAAPQTQFQDEASDFEDWLELHNASGSAVDVSGMYLTDDLGDPTKWVLPASTSIPAGGHLVVWCDDEPGDGPLHAAFTLPTAGGELGLFDTDGATLLDFIHWTPQTNEVAFGRYEDARQFWQQLPTPTPGAANTTAGNLPPFVTWTEHEPPLPRSTDDVTVSCLARDADGLSGVELFYQVDGGGYTSAAMTALPADRWSAEIPAQADGALVEYYVTATDTQSATHSDPQDAPADVFAYTVNDPVPGDLRVHELMASNTSTIQDEMGDFEDWIELRNASGATISLGGMYMSDNLSDPTKWEIPAGTTIAPGEFLIVWADDEPGEGPLHATFRLSAGGEAIGLFDTDANGNAVLDSYTFGQQLANVSLGYLPDPGFFRHLLYLPTPGASNRPPPGTTGAFQYPDPALNVVDLAAASAPDINTLFSVDVAGGDPGNWGAVWWGVVTTQLLFPPDGAVLVLPITALVDIFVFDGSGEATSSLFLPNDPSLVGATIYSQGWGLTISYSNGLAATIGP